MSHRDPSPTLRLEQDIARQRAELADTVDALHRKLDVKTRVRDGLTTDAGKVRPQVLAVAVVALAAVSGLVVLRLRNR